jgi:hypothetical protein
MRRALWGGFALSVPALLGCAGLSERAMDLVGESPEFQKSFKESFKTQFVEQCVAAAEGAPAGKTREVCTCAADDLLAKRSPKELTKFLAKADEPAVAKELAEIMKGCLR